MKSPSLFDLVYLNKVSSKKQKETVLKFWAKQVNNNKKTREALNYCPAVCFESLEIIASLSLIMLFLLIQRRISAAEK